jgi:hypothetical protein
MQPLLKIIVDFTAFGVIAQFRQTLSEKVVIGTLCVV